MRQVFADTFFFLALINQNDAAHHSAVAYSSTHDDALITTAWVLTEVANGLARSSQRAVFPRLLAKLRSSPASEIIPPSAELMDRGVALYADRADKHWSLTDCISFIVMEDRGIRDALTGDHHFRQGGFNALLV